MSIDGLRETISPHAMGKLQTTRELLQHGLEIKPGKLNVLRQALAEVTARRDFLLFLLEEANRDLPDDPLVQRYFNAVNELVSNLASPSCMGDLKVIESRIFAIQPWQKRLYVHTKRRRVQYVELYFLEMLVKALTETRKGRSYYCQEAAKLFVFDYVDMRYRVGDKTLPHWNAIVDYWQRR